MLSQLPPHETVSVGPLARDELSCRLVYTPGRAELDFQRTDGLVTGHTIGRLKCLCNRSIRRPVKVTASCRNFVREDFADVHKVKMIKAKPPSLLGVEDLETEYIIENLSVVRDWRS